MKLTKNDIARIFGSRDKTPPELELELALVGATFTPLSFCKIVSAVLLEMDWRQEDPERLFVKSDGKLYIKDVSEPYISIRIIKNLIRLIKFSKVFDNALKAKEGLAV